MQVVVMMRFLLISAVTLVQATCTSQAGDTVPPGIAAITPGNGSLNQIDLNGLERHGATLIVADVLSATPAFLVVHPFANGQPVREDYVAATPIPAGASTDVPLLLDGEVPAGTPMIVMLHEDVNRDGVFQFGDGITVPDRPVIEGTTLIALPTEAPEARAITPDDIRGSAALHAEKAVTLLERAPYRGDGREARQRALVHRWMELVERPDRNAQSFQDILSDDFYLGFSSGPIDTLEDFDAWLKGPGSSVAATAHQIVSFASEPLGNDRHALNFVLDWNGLTPDGGRMQAKTNHSWTVRDNGNGYPVIERVEVEALESFRVTDWE